MTPPAHANRLIHQKSPYLRQHARNPVDWHPWGEEAFEKARRENKPVFLSVGYSTCHWCHVMERESFADEAIAAILNRHFVPVKVDREERPDVDRVYMAYVQATTGGGGWPMSVWLTPDLKPFLGGTYFPPEGRWGRPGFGDLLQRIADAWVRDPGRIATAANDSLAHLRTATASAEPPSPSAGTIARPETMLDRAVAHFQAAYDPQYGGFGGAPKFPRPSVPDFLLRDYTRTRRRDVLDMTLHTLRAMAEGGMYDHLGGGFHRYAVDDRWRVPHFEKMLYDQAQLVTVFLDAYQLTRDDFFARIARETLAYVRRDLTGPEGRFFSAEDADSDRPGQPGVHAEGAFYVWSFDEIRALLGSDTADVFAFRHGMKTGGNVREDPHGEFTGLNILYAARGIAAVAERFARPPGDIERQLDEARAALFAARTRRPRPHLDDKTITAWNGLMISAFARAAQVLDDPLCLDTACGAARFIRDRLWNPRKGELLRRYCDGESAIPAFAEDYACLIRGLLDLYEAGFDAGYLEWAVALQSRMDALFRDETAGGYFSTTGRDPDVLLRMKEDHDGAEPSAGAIATHNLLRLAQLTGQPGMAAHAEKTLAARSRVLLDTPGALPAMLSALAFHHAGPVQVAISGDPETDDTKALLRAVHSLFLPHKVLRVTPRDQDQRDPGQPVTPTTVQVCQQGVCHPPVATPEDVVRLLS